MILTEDTVLWVSKIGRIVIWKIDKTNIPELQLNVNYSHPHYDEIINFTESTVYQIEKDGYIHDVFMGSILKQEDQPKTGLLRKIPRIEHFYAICEPSMRKIDPLIRDFIGRRYTINKRSVSIEAVAGSGKTEILLRIAANHNSNVEMKKNILYIAFNKALVTGITQKQRLRKLMKLEPMTFDSMLYREVRHRYGGEIVLTDLTRNSLSNIYPQFQKKYFNIQKKIIRQFSTFCQQIEHPTIQSMYPDLPHYDMVFTLWNDTKSGKLITFDGIRKLAYEEQWLKEKLNVRYDMVLVDEAQDFDPVMLAILLRDANIPKIFVGDPKQQIYEWRGTINAFEHLPENTLKLKFYSTFRMGGEGVQTISKMTNTPMITANESLNTQVISNETPSSPYTYIFRTWKCLLLTAQKSNDGIWIYEYDKKIASINRLHARLQKCSLSKEELQEYEDDLPAFLMKLSCEDLNKLKDEIDSKMAPSAELASCRFATIHSFKGMEDDIIRVYGDIDKENESNLYYVALTRARKFLYVDSFIPPSSTTHTPSCKKKTVITLPDTPIHTELREWRLKKARSTGKQSASIMTNSTLNDLVVRAPRTLAELLSVTGIGPKKQNEYGTELLRILESYSNEIPSVSLPVTKCDEKMSECMVLTNDHILSGSTTGDGHGYKAQQLKLLDINYPLVKGWKETIIGKSFSKQIIDRFITFNQNDRRGDTSSFQRKLDVMFTK